MLLQMWFVDHVVRVHILVGAGGTCYSADLGPCRKKTHWLESGLGAQESVCLKATQLPLFRRKGSKIGNWLLLYLCCRTATGSSAVNMKINPICGYQFSEGQSEATGSPAVSAKEAFHGSGQGGCMWRGRGRVGNRAGGGEENDVPWDTGWPFIAILRERLAWFILNELLAELSRDLFEINMRRRNTWTEVWTSMLLGLVINLSSFVYNK